MSNTFYYGSLHNHTHYSNLRLRDSINTTETLIARAIELGHTGIAITEHETVSNAIEVEECYAAIKKEHPDFKVIRGNEIYLVRNGLNKDNFDKERDRYTHFILLALDAEGHKQIRELSSRAWKRSYITRGQRRVPTYYQDLVDVIGDNRGHIVASTACIGGTLGVQLLRYRESRDESLLEKIKIWCQRMDSIFGHGNFYLEMQPSNFDEQLYVNSRIISLSEELDIPYIVTNDAHYLRKEDLTIEKIFLNSQGGDREVESFYAYTYLMGDAEMRSFMEASIGKERLEIAYKNIQSIFDRATDYTLKRELHIPSLPWRDFEEVPELERNHYFELMPNLKQFFTSEFESDRTLVNAVIQGIKNHSDLQNKEAYDELNLCLQDTWVSSQANKAQWSAYFLNLQKILDVCWDAGTIIGCGRGSGVGFLLLYCLDITQINPLREQTKTFRFRFLNPERVSVLDVDSDISGLNRSKVLDYIRSYYGQDRVANVMTLRTEKPKSAILAACLKPGAKINTISGLKNVENITSNDYVYTTNGIEQVITPTFREYNGKLYTFKSGIGTPFTVTHNHQLLVYTNRHKQEKDGCQNYKECQLLDNHNNVLGTFTSIKQAAEYYAKKYNGSFTSMYKYKTVNGYSIVEMPAVKNHTIQWLVAEDISRTDYLLTPVYNTHEYKKQLTFTYAEQNPYKKSVNYIKENIILNEEFCELAGIYLAEGNINSNQHGITFTISKEEEWLKNRITYLLNSVFGINEQYIGYYLKADSAGLSIKVHSSPLGRFFDKYFYGNAHTKNIGIINYLPFNLQKYTLYGCYYGDGYGRIRQNGSYEGKITSVSYQLIADLWQIAARNGYNCSVITEQRQSLTYNLMFYGQTAESLYKSKYLHELNLNWDQDEYLSYNGINYYPTRILDISKDDYNGEVYCLETPSHDYLLNNIVSHNCRGLGIDVDTAQYIASLIPAERGLVWPLSDCMYGNEAEGREPIKQFVHEMTKNYPEIWDVVKRTENLIVGYGEHAGGLIFVDEPFENSTALMRAPNGDIMTQFELHASEKSSLIKYDMLSVEAIDKIQICIQLLQEYGYIDKSLSLREAYQQTIGIYNLDRTSPEMWNMVYQHAIHSLFQLTQQSGINGIEVLHPSSVDDLAVLNSAIRLMAQEKGGEMPVDKLARFKQDENAWDEEIAAHNLNIEETKQLLQPVLDTSYGLCIAQEQFMQLVQMPELGGMTLTESDALRKSIAKKNPAAYEKWMENYKKVCDEKGLDSNLIDYVIELIGMSKGYGFRIN